jgi:hypothetical protein
LKKCDSFVEKNMDPLKMTDNSLKYQIDPWKIRITQWFFYPLKSFVRSRSCVELLRLFTNSGRNKYSLLLSLHEKQIRWKKGDQS